MNKLITISFMIILVLVLAACSSDMNIGGSATPPPQSGASDPIPSGTELPADNQTTTPLVDPNRPPEIGDFLGTEVIKKYSHQPIEGFELIFHGYTNYHYWPEVKDIKMVVDGVVRELTPSYDNFTWHYYERPNISVYYFALGRDEVVTQYPSKTWFEMVLNGIPIQTATVDWKSDETFSIIEPPAVTTLITLDTPTRSTAPPFDMAMINQSAYSVRKEVSGNMITFTIRDENMAEAYALDTINPDHSFLFEIYMLIADENDTYAYHDNLFILERVFGIFHPAPVRYGGSDERDALLLLDEYRIGDLELNTTTGLLADAYVSFDFAKKEIIVTGRMTNPAVANWRYLMDIIINGDEAMSDLGISERSRVRIWVD